VAGEQEPWYEKRRKKFAGYTRGEPGLAPTTRKGGQGSHSSGRCGYVTSTKGAMKIISVITTLVVALALATTASAQQASQDGYLNSAGQVQAQVDQGGSGGDSGGSLPFTGLDMALLAGAGGLLVAAGFGVRRLTRFPDSA
jgi:hypothetical protein